ncbi:MAG: pyridoxamine 5'-phosphate oxidase family protein [Hyphomicrobiaceae bacterium]|nr:pyridoxamine 5'-phosphate oxidase family protein [Hyphomicrobiaceae bacterium]
MGHRFLDIAFTDAVKAVQQRQGSRGAYAAREGGGVDVNDRLGAGEASFIAERDSFYMATVSETGWPYVQHRGGPKGFLRVLDESTIGFADFAGNRQYVSVGNLAANDRVSLFLMDYPNRKRLKILGRARLVGGDEGDVMAKLTHPGYRARIERGLLITIAAFDWNCPQHITPRFADGDGAREQT